MWTINGWPVGRPLTSKMRATAAGWRASAASPYTVSVGIATSPPRRSASAARATSVVSRSARDGIDELERGVDEGERLRRREVIGASQCLERCVGECADEPVGREHEVVVADDDQHRTVHTG